LANRHLEVVRHGLQFMGRVVWDALREIEDRRGRQGRNSELRLILGIAVGTMLAGSNDLLSIFR